MYKYLGQLFTGEPVMLNDKIGLHQLTIGELLNAPHFDELMLPFVVDLETIDIGLVKRPEWTYDLFFLTDDQGEPVLKSNSGESLLILLALALGVLCKTTNIQMLDSGAILVDGSFAVTKLNFDSVAEAVRELYCRETEVGEKPPESPRQYEIWKETMAGRKKVAQRNAPTLYDIVNIVTHYNFNIRYKEVMSITLWQLMNSFEQLASQDEYRDFTLYASNAMTKIKEKDRVKHWTTTSRLFKKKKKD